MGGKHSLLSSEDLDDYQVWWEDFSTISSCELVLGVDIFYSTRNSRRVSSILSVAFYQSLWQTSQTFKWTAEQTKCVEHSRTSSSSDHLNLIWTLRCFSFLFKCNPFRQQIVEVFSSHSDGSLSFEDFLDMMSVFSKNAPKSVKVSYAFKIYRLLFHLCFLFATFFFHFSFPEGIYEGTRPRQ